MPAKKGKKKGSVPAVPLSQAVQALQPTNAGDGGVIVLLSDDRGTAGNWVEASKAGSAQVSFSNPLPIEIVAQPNPPSAIELRTKRLFTSDVDATFELLHRGFGRTNIGLWSVQRNSWGPLVILDTNDTNYLAFSAGGPSTEYKYSGSPYMNRWVKVRIQVAGPTIRFFTDDNLMETMSRMDSGGLQIELSVGSVSWKSGANDTAFRLVTAVGDQH